MLESGLLPVPRLRIALRLTVTRARLLSERSTLRISLRLTVSRILRVPRLLPVPGILRIHLLRSHIQLRRLPVLIRLLRIRLLRRGHAQLRGLPPLRIGLPVRRLRGMIPPRRIRLLWLLPVGIRIATDPAWWIRHLLTFRGPPGPSPVRHSFPKRKRVIDHDPITR
ncbi:hypothetical protein JMUB6875_54760 [Nocardia sp. JMUB6875]